MFITPKLKKQIEQAADEWLGSPDCKVPNKKNIKRPFKVCTEQDTKELVGIISDKVGHLSDKKQLDEWLGWYNPYYNSDNSDNSYYKVASVDGYYKPKENTFQQLQDSYGIPDAVKKELYRSALFAPYADAIGITPTRLARIQQHTWQELWEDKKRELTRAYKDAERMYNNATRGVDMQYKRLVALEGQLRELSGKEKITPTSKDIRELLCMNDRAEAERLKQLYLLYVYTAPEMHKEEWEDFYHPGNHLWLSLRSQIWKEIHADYRNFSETNQREPLSLEDCIASKEELAFYLHGKYKEADTKSFIADYKHRPGNFSRLRTMIGSYLPNSEISEKSMKGLFANYLTATNETERLKPINVFVGEPSRATKDTLAFFLGFSSWNSFCRGISSSSARRFPKVVHSEYAKVSDFYDLLPEGTEAIKVTLVEHGQDAALYKYGLPSFICLRPGKRGGMFYEVLSMDGFIQGMAVGDEIYITTLEMEYPMQFMSGSKAYVTSQMVGSYAIVQEYEAVTIEALFVNLQWKDELKIALETAFKLPLNSNKALGILSDRLVEKDCRVDRKTLIRMWGEKGGYENVQGKDTSCTTTTLDSLVGALGYDSWKDFVVRYILHAEPLEYPLFRLLDFCTGNRIKANYFPNRILEFTIIEEEGIRKGRIDRIDQSKILRNKDVFICDFLQVGSPLKFSEVRHVDGDQDENYESSSVKELLIWKEGKWIPLRTNGAD